MAILIPATAQQGADVTAACQPSRGAMSKPTGPSGGGPAAASHIRKGPLLPVLQTHLVSPW